MFSSPCSLRSTQCAALIALATAAGIARFETAESDATATNGNRAPVTQETTATASFRADFFQFALRALAPWFGFSASSSLTRAADTANEIDGAARGLCFAATGRLVVAPAVAKAAPFPVVQTVAALPARQHSYPFAVGPPRSELNSTPAAESTSVPSDSAARREVISRIAALFPFSSVARLARPEFSGPGYCRPLVPFPPASALRGEARRVSDLTTPVAYGFGAHTDRARGKLPASRPIATASAQAAPA